MNLKISEKEKTRLTSIGYFLAAILYLAIAAWCILTIFSIFTINSTKYHSIASNSTLIENELATIHVNPELYFYEKGEHWLHLGFICVILLGTLLFAFWAATECAKLTTKYSEKTGEKKA